MNAQQHAFLKLVVPPAQAAQKKWGVPASVTLAQAIFESSNHDGWGQSQLAREYENYFGIKAEHLADPNTYVELLTDEYVNNRPEDVEAKFERYPSIADSFDDHGRKWKDRITAHKFLTSISCSKRRVSKRRDRYRAPPGGPRRDTMRLQNP